MKPEHKALVKRLRDHQNGGRRGECEEAADAIVSLSAELAAQIAHTETIADFQYKLLAELQYLTHLAEEAMNLANSDGAEYDIDAELRDARTLLGRPTEAK